MEECYALLGISPAASTEDIEEAYRKKQDEFSPLRFQQSSPEWESASLMQKKLDRAYNDAIMAAFAPIRAFAAPGGANVASPQYAKPAAPFPSSPLPSMPEPSQLPETLPPLNAETLRSHYAGPVGVPPAPESFSESLSESLQRLTKEIPSSLSDEELRKLNAEALRGSHESEYELENKRSDFLTLGIEDKLLRFYARTYLAFVIVDLILLFAWGGELRDAPLWQSVLASFLSRANVLLWSLPIPIIARFIHYGEPVTEKNQLCALIFLSSVIAWIPHFLTRLLLGFFVLGNKEKILTGTAAWAGSASSLIVASIVICVGTLVYKED